MDKVKQAIEILQDVADTIPMSIEDLETISSTIEVLMNME